MLRHELRVKCLLGLIHKKKSKKLLRYNKQKTIIPTIHDIRIYFFQMYRDF